MVYKSKHYFFRCVYCGAWFYTNRIIKRKKCTKCYRSFAFEKSLKFTQKCSSKEAIAYIQQLKAQGRNIASYS